MNINKIVGSLLEETVTSAVNWYSIGSLSGELKRINQSQSSKAYLLFKLKNFKVWHCATSTSFIGVSVSFQESEPALDIYIHSHLFISATLPHSYHSCQQTQQLSDTKMSLDAQAAHNLHVQPINKMHLLHFLFPRYPLISLIISQQLFSV